MGNEVTLQLTTLYAFLAVLARISGALVFVPIPNLSGSPAPVRIVLVLTLTLALYPVWPVIKVVPGTGMMVGWLLSEGAMGITIGLVVAFIAEAFGLFGQMIALNSGHSFASTVDPTTQADSGIFVVMSQSDRGDAVFRNGNAPANHTHLRAKPGNTATRIFRDLRGNGKQHDPAGVQPYSPPGCVWPFPWLGYWSWSI